MVFRLGLASKYKDIVSSFQILRSIGPQSRLRYHYNAHVCTSPVDLK